MDRRRSAPPLPKRTVAYEGIPPIVSSVDPATDSALGGVAITVRGFWFTVPGHGATTIDIGGEAATSVVIVNSTTITAVAPAAASGGAVDLVLTNSLGTDTLTGGFTYTIPAPTLTDVDPATGAEAGGVEVTLTGTGFQDFTPGTNVVEFGGVAATSVVVVSDTEITCDTPAGAGEVDVVLTNDNGVATLPDGFTYT